jgi:hypothetical protein
MTFEVMRRAESSVTNAWVRRARLFHGELAAKRKLPGNGLRRDQADELLDRAGLH